VKFFDAHAHLATPDSAGLEAFLRFTEMQPHLVGANLILNTEAEVEVVSDHLDSLPSTVVLVPYFDPEHRHPDALRSAGWYKLHPRLQRLDDAAIPSLVSALRADDPRGVIVHAFPWGPELRFNISLPLVIALAEAMPATTILVAHGGGYESWQFRAHAGGFENVHFEFSATLDYYAGTDAVAVLARYLAYSPGRIHFGSDWPSGDVQRQLTELLRLATDAGLTETALESLLLQNAAACWPTAFAGDSGA
jgi:predicted TIM-barrel fold metal-dependent hydrolase